MLSINRSSLYYKPKPQPPEDIVLMNLLDEEHIRRPFYGVRRMREYLSRMGYNIGKDRVRTLLRRMGLMAIYPTPRTSRPHPKHKKYPYLLRGLKITRPTQVWSADITYIRLLKGFAYLVAIVDWFSRYILSWRLSNSLDADFCVDALKEALELGTPDIFNTDQGAQFTSDAFIELLLEKNIQISMDSRGRALDNIFIERLWRSVKYEDVYLHGYQDIPEALLGLKNYFEFYNTERFHQALNYKTPWEIHSGLYIPTLEILPCEIVS